MKFILVFLLTILLISCNDEKFNCSTCKENQICNIEQKECLDKIDPCKGLTCSNHGKCNYNAVNQTYCKCDLGYHSEAMECIKNDTENSCLGVSCSNHGKCQENGTSPSCICDNGYHTNGLNCIKDIEEKCNNGNKKCDSNNNLLECINNTWNKKSCNNQICQESNDSASCINDDIKEGTIHAIRKGKISENTEVTVTAIVTAVKLSGSKISGIYIQEEGPEYRGIFVYIKNKIIMELNIGDEIKVTGIYKEYHNLSEIAVEESDKIEKTGNNSEISQYREITVENLVSQNLEKYESMLVSITGDFTVKPRDEKGNFVIVSNNSEFLIKDELYDFNLNENSHLSEIKGILDFNYGKFKILPRNESEIVDNSQMCNAVNCEENKVCIVKNNAPLCVCDENSNYFDDGTGNCKNPCENNPCTEENKTTCKSINADNYNCECNSGFFLNESNICEKADSCDPAIYSDALNKTGNELKEALHTITGSKFNSYGYDDGRIAMFSYIDNHDGVIQCIYSGEYYEHPYEDDMSKLHKGCSGCADKPQNEIFNWEHTWPKSKGSGTMPAKADLHHLFPTRNYVNSARSSLDFGNVNSNDTYTCDDGNIAGYCCEDEADDDFVLQCGPTLPEYVSKRGGGKFEVANQHKGNTARAMFYMYVRYKLGGNNYLTSTEAKTLREWHKLDEVDDIEKERNNKVEMFQHNRNPFVDCPQFVDALFE